MGWNHITHKLLALLSSFQPIRHSTTLKSTTTKCSNSSNLWAVETLTVATHVARQLTRSERIINSSTTEEKFPNEWTLSRVLESAAIPPNRFSIRFYHYRHLNKIRNVIPHLQNQIVRQSCGTIWLWGKWYRYQDPKNSAVDVLWSCVTRTSAFLFSSISTIHLIW